MTARRIIPALAATALGAATLVLIPTTAGGQSAGCSQPYSPVAFANAYPAQEALPEVPGTDVATEPAVDTTVDSDGDGVDDTIDATAGDSATITRGSGELVLTASGATSMSIASVQDIDGDGRDEIAVLVDEGLDAGTYLVPGTTPDGTVAVVDAGIVLDEVAALPVLQPDGTDRLIVWETAAFSGAAPATRIFDATDTLALGPGSDASGTQEQEWAGELIAFADQGGGVLSLVIGAVPAEDILTLRLVQGDGEELVFTSEPELAFSDDPGPFGELAVIVGSEGTFIRLLQTSRSGSGHYLWSVDDPCTAYTGPTAVAPTTTPIPTAPAAQPVATDATFTG